jgi:hypothetical protein
VAGNGAVTLSGFAAISVVYIEVNGILYAPTWSSLTAWNVVVPLAPGSNTLVIRGIDYNGAAVSGATSNLNVNNPYVNGWPALRISEWLAENDALFRDPADNDSDDWFEIYNPTAAAADLSGWKITDVPNSPSPFVVPNGWTIPAGGFLLVWADNETAQNPATPGPNSALHVPFRLNNTGDAIQLLAPDSHVIDLVSFGEQSANRSEGRFPETAAAWGRLTLPTPGAANVLTTLGPPVFGDSGTAVQFSTTPGVTYTLQWSSDLTGWQDVAPPQVATGTDLTVTDFSTRPMQRMYRVKLSR